MEQLLTGMHSRPHIEPLQQAKHEKHIEGLKDSSSSIPLLTTCRCHLISELVSDSEGRAIPLWFIPLGVKMSSCENANAKRVIARIENRLHDICTGYGQTPVKFVIPHHR